MYSPKNQLIPFYEAQLGTWQLKIERQSFNNKELTKRFDQIAKKWHTMLQRLGYHTAYEDMWRRFFQTDGLAFQEAKSMAVLDCGTGTGSFSAAFARVWSGPIDLSGIDASQEMLWEAETRYSREGITVDLRCADASNLPYLDNEFDIVMTAHVLEHLPNPKKALKELKRVLKPGGYLVIGATRDSLLGRYIHLKWRTHLFTKTKLMSWIESVGLDVLDSDITLLGLFGRTSLVSISQKPGASA